MDSVVAAALEEICARGSAGLTLPELWPSLGKSLSSAGLPLCAAVKSAVWKRLRRNPALRREFPAGRDPYSVDEAEALALTIVAEKHLRDSFLGLDDLKAADGGVTEDQVSVLERIAIARNNGITQSELCKHLGFKGNNFFYKVRSLECQQLIVRKSTVVKRRDLALDNSFVANNTNLMVLYRYGKDSRLGSQQRIEIIKPDKSASLCIGNGNNVSGNDCGESLGEDVQIKDFLPSMKSVCDMLGAAAGKVLVASDIKLSLGFKKKYGHRSWRILLSRMKDAGLVEEFPAVVDGRERTCLRLVSKFYPEKFEQRDDDVCGYNAFESELLEKLAKKGQITEQLVELPFEHVMYNIIDAEGSKGIPINEVTKRLGLNNKRMHSRIIEMVEKYQLHVEAEKNKKTAQYRIWTSKDDQNLPQTREENVDEVEFPACSKNVMTNQSSSVNVDNLNLCTTDEVPHTNMLCSQEIGLDCWDEGLGHTHKNQVIQSAIISQSHILEDRHLNCDTNVSFPCDLSVSNISEEVPSLPSSTKSSHHSAKRYPCLSLTALGAKREQMILERLKNEKFILKSEISRWFAELENGKTATMDNKTVRRMLGKLVDGGFCKLIRVEIPVLTNFHQNRSQVVVLDSSVCGLSSDLLDQIYAKQRAFDFYTRTVRLNKARIHSQGSTQPSSDEPAITMTNVERLPCSIGKVSGSPSMVANGFVNAKMVRVRLLHYFFWEHLRCSSDRFGALNSRMDICDMDNPYMSCELFDLETAVKAMPLQLFLQVVGYAIEIGDLVQKCRRGTKLCDLSLQEYRQLMNTDATNRLSSVIDILVRLKLIQLVRASPVEDHMVQPNVVLTHALELKPFLEEVLPGVISSSTSNHVPYSKIRHEYVLSNQENVNSYWEKLEYCYAAADPAIASHAFPGTAVREVFRSRSWRTVRVMTAEQRQELLKRIDAENTKKKIPFPECIKIAGELGLTLEQVLRFSYDKRSHCHPKRKRGSDKFESVSRRRKRGSRDRQLELSSSKDAMLDCSLSQTILSDGNLQAIRGSMDLSTNSQYASRHQDNGDDRSIDPAMEMEPIAEDSDAHAFVYKNAFYRSMLIRKKKFLWTDISDRKLVEHYAKHRAIMGARFSRIDWTSIDDLPSAPATCRRRMAILKNDANWWKSVLKLCDILGGRYIHYLEQIRKAKGETVAQQSSTEYLWDDFDDPIVKLAVEEVLQLKKMIKRDSTKRVASNNGKEWSNLSQTAAVNANDRSSRSGEGLGEKHQNPAKITLSGQNNPNLNSKGDLSDSRLLCESSSVANAAELLKLVLLSTSSSPEMQRSLGDTLHFYSEEDIFSAFNYLKDEDYVVSGHGSRPYVLTRKFFEDASSSSFPVDTGKRALKFSSWLCDNEDLLMLDGVDLISELQCGELLHLFGLVASGEFSISPCMPDEGIGEVDELSDAKSSVPFEDVYSIDEPIVINKKCDDDMMTGDENCKKAKPPAKLDGDCSFRRAKGFPGLKVVVHRSLISACSTLSSLTQPEGPEFQSLCDEQNQEDVNDSARRFGTFFPGRERGKVDAKEMEILSGETVWDAMARYAVHTLPAFVKSIGATSCSPEMFKCVHSAICQAGEQGLKMEEVSKLVLEDIPLTKGILDALEVYQFIVKVNAFDCIRMVDSSYRSKYFISVPCDYKKDPPLDQEACGVPVMQSFPENNDDFQTSKEGPAKFDGLMQEDAVLDREISAEGGGLLPSMAEEVSYMPILPWINGDGSINAVMHKGLSRRLLGIVMQNPGIMEDHIIHRMNVLNPQSCRQLLESLILDNHIFSRTVHQAASSTLPAILRKLPGSDPGATEHVIRKHYFANPMSTHLL